MISSDEFNKVEALSTVEPESEISEEEALAMAQEDAKKVSSGSFITRVLNASRQKHPRGEETRQMMKKIREGCLKTREEFTRRNLRLVFTLTIKFCKARGVRVTSPYFEDLFQEGLMGMVTAIDRYDLDRGFEFSTYATHWINQALSRGWVDVGPSVVRKPVHRQEQTRLVARSIRVLEKENPDRDINSFKAEEIAEAMVDSVGYMSAFAHTFQKYQEDMEEHGEVRKGTRRYIIGKLTEYISDIMDSGDLINDFGRYRSTDQELETSEGEGSALRDFMTYEVDDNDYAQTPEMVKLSQNDRDILSYVIATLTEREREIVRQRFVLGDTLEETGAVYKLTRERIRQIQGKALRKIRYGVSNFRKMKQKYNAKMDNDLYFDPFFTDNKRAAELVYIEEKGRELQFVDDEPEDTEVSKVTHFEENLSPVQETNTIFKDEPLSPGAKKLLERVSSRQPKVEVSQKDKDEARERLDHILAFNHITADHSCYQSAMLFFVEQMSQKAITEVVGINKTSVFRHVRSIQWLLGTIEPKNQGESEQLRKLVDPYTGKDNRANARRNTGRDVGFRSDDYLQDLSVLLPVEDPITRNGLGHLPIKEAFQKLRLRCKNGEKFTERQEQITQMYVRQCLTITDVEDLTGTARNNGFRAVKCVIKGLGLL